VRRCEGTGIACTMGVPDRTPRLLNFVDSLPLMTTHSDLRVFLILVLCRKPDQKENARLHGTNNSAGLDDDAYLHSVGRFS